MGIRAGDTVFLTAKNKHGKDVIHNHGSIWDCLRTTDNLAMRAVTGTGPFALIKSGDGDLRWIAETDNNFNWSIMEG